MPAEEEVPEFTKHAVPLASDLTNLSRVLLQALAYAFGEYLFYRVVRVYLLRRQAKKPQDLKDVILSVR